MNDSVNYKAAYERQKKAREQAESALEQVSRELYENHQTLLGAYNSLKEQKAQLLHQEKLASIGQLSAGVAHEINNPTGYVLSNLSTIQSYFNALKTYCDKLESIALQTANTSTNSEIDEAIRKAKEQLDIDYVLEDFEEAYEDSSDGLKRIQDIVSQLKNFARPDAKNKESMSLNECINTTLKLVNNQLKYKAELILKLAELPDIQGRKGEISQVLLNLLTNAIDAIEERGIITIETKANDAHVLLMVSDNGVGIEEDELNKIFDPFFSTKELGKGTGLGLSISHGIIQQHGGSLEVKSQRGEGTTFVVSLPMQQ